MTYGHPSLGFAHTLLELSPLMRAGLFFVDFLFGKLKTYPKVGCAEVYLQLVGVVFVVRDSEGGAVRCVVDMQHTVNLNGLIFRGR